MEREIMRNKESVSLRQLIGRCSDLKDIESVVKLMKEHFKLDSDFATIEFDVIKDTEWCYDIAVSINVNRSTTDLTYFIGFNVLFGCLLGTKVTVDNSIDHDILVIDLIVNRSKIMSRNKSHPEVGDVIIYKHSGRIRIGMVVKMYKHLDVPFLVHTDNEFNSEPTTRLDKCNFNKVAIVGKISATLLNDRLNKNKETT